MNRAKYNSIVINANYKARLWMGIALLMIVSNVVLAYFVVNAETTEKTVLVPLTITQPFSVSGDELSPEYLEQMARYFAQLLLSYHKANARAQFDDVLKYFDPSVYATMQSRFAIDVERIQRTNIASVFHIMKTHVIGNTVYLTGEHKGMIGRNVVSQTQQTYEMRFQYEGSGLTVLAFNRVKRLSDGGYEKIEPYEEQIIEPEAMVPQQGAVQ